MIDHVCEVVGYECTSPEWATHCVYRVTLRVLDCGVPYEYDGWFRSHEDDGPPTEWTWDRLGDIYAMQPGVRGPFVTESFAVKSLEHELQYDQN